MASIATDLASAQPDRSLADHQQLLLQAAIAVLVSGGARRVTVVGIEPDDGLLTEVEAVARRHGLKASVLRRGDSGGVVLEPIA